LGCDGVARVDFLLEGGPDDPRVWINEINAIPGSLSFYLWEATGIGFSTLLDRLVGGALKRARARGHKTVSYPANIFSLPASAPGPKTGAR
jgi:D-alanine-D-alanine ligase